MPPPRSEAQYIPPDGHGEAENRAIGFTQNMGQLRHPDGTPANEVSFYSEGGLPRAFIRAGSKVSFVMSQVDTSLSTIDTLRRVDMTVVGELSNEVTPYAYSVRDWHQNFYLPSTGNDGVTEVYGYHRVIYEDIYSDIDWHFYSAESGQKMSFVIRPGGDPSDIQLQFTGQDSIYVNAFGLLQMYMQGHWLVLNQAIAYQVAADSSIIPVSWAPQYVANSTGGVVSFTFGSYDPSKPLVVQVGPPPALMGGYDEYGLCWSTYMGGPGAESIIEVDQHNSLDWMYVTGSTTSDIFDFPVAIGNTYYSGGTVAFTMGFNSTDEVAWKTFVGGDPGEYCESHGLAVKQGVSGVVYMGCTTNSPSMLWNQPNTEHINTVMPPNSGGQGFIARMVLLDGTSDWRTYFGSNTTGMVNSSTTIQSVDIAVDGRLFIGGTHFGCCAITPTDDPPPTGSAYWGPSGLTGDGYVAMFSSADRLNWLTYFPGELIMGGTACPIENVRIVCGGQSVVVMGDTWGEMLPVIPAGGGYQQNPWGVGTTMDLFLYEFNLQGGMLWGTYFGGETHDEFLDSDISPAAMSIDPITQDLVICCRAGGSLPGNSPFPTSNPGWSQTSNIASGGGFLARFSGLDRELLWSSYFHGSSGSWTELLGTSFDEAGNLYVHGSFTGTGLANTPLSAYYYSPTTLTNTNSGTPVSDNDAFVVSFDDQLALRYGTYFGGYAGSDNEKIYELIQRDSNSRIYVVGGTSKDVPAALFGTYFPLDDGGGTPYFESAWQGGAREGFIASLCDGGPTGIAQSPRTPHPGTLTVDPLGNFVVLGLGGGMHQVRLIDVTGRIVREASIASTNERLVMPATGLSTGVYSVSVDDRWVGSAFH